MAFARTALASWRRVATAAADSRRALETERLVGECAAFAAERDSLEASLAEARRALERPDRDGRRERRNDDARARRRDAFNAFVIEGERAHSGHATTRRRDGDTSERRDL